MSVTSLSNSSPGPGAIAEGFQTWQRPKNLSCWRRLSIWLIP